MKKLLLIALGALLCMPVFAQNFNYSKKITPDNSQRTASEQFGGSTAISGNYAVIGARFSRLDSAGNNSIINMGSAYIWELDTNTGEWGQVKKITPRGTNARCGSCGNLFGNAVGADGDYIIVGHVQANFDSAGSNSRSRAGVAYIWERNSAGAWTQVKRLSAPDRAANDAFGTSVAVSGNYAIIGAPAQNLDSAGNNDTADAGAAYIFERRSGVWGLAKKITPPGTNNARRESDFFGISVAISGNYAVIGAYGQDYDSAGGNLAVDAGAAYVYELVNNEWIYIKKLTPPTTNNARLAGDLFGASVAIDGNTIVVGAYGQDYDAGGANSSSIAGAAYTFERVNGVWGYVNKITPNSITGDRNSSDNFGAAVDIDGDIIIAGAYNNATDSTQSNSLSTAGAAYIFEKNNGVWSYAKKITPPNSNNDRVTADIFGVAVAIDDNYALVGAYQQDYDSSGANYINGNTGAAYFFKDYTLRYNSGWENSQSPSSGTGSYDCRILAGTATIPAGSAIRKLNVSSGATATLSGDLDIDNDYTNSGTVSGSGTAILSGTSAQSIYGTGTTNNLTLNNSTGATIQDSLKIAGVFTHTLGTLTTGGKLRLVATNDTVYGQIASTGTGTISGNVIAEYSISGDSLGFRPICSPVNGATLNELSDDLSLNYGTPDNHYCTIWTFDEGTSPYWSPATGSSQSMDATVFSIYTGGSSSWANPLPLTMDISGTYGSTTDYTVNNLTRTGSVTNQTGWHYIRNPWPSGFTWNGTGANVTVGAGGVQGQQVWIYDVTAGAYISFDNTTPGVVPPFHPFTLEVTSNNSSLTFLNLGRTTGTMANYFNKTGLANVVEVTVADENGKTDKVKFYTDPNATNGYDVMDGNKMMNTGIQNLYFVQENRSANKLVYNTLPHSSEFLSLNFDSKKVGKYTLSFTSENLEPNTTVELVDKFSGTIQDISEGPYTFNHNITNVNERFELHFNKTSSTGIPEEEENTVYVGSTDNQITVLIANPGSYTIEVVDLLGRTIKQPATFESKGNQPQTIIVNGISAGYYLVKVNGDDLFKTVKIFLN